ncbi:hypothetical protein RyT2_18330 [Pseudolactococcus yaeyamensis]
MVLYKSKLEQVYQQKNENRYSRAELEKLTTLQLRDICYREKIVKGIANRLDRDMFIETILHFRGVNDDYLIREYRSEGFKTLSKVIQKNLGTQLPQSETIYNPAKITIFNGLAIEERDAYQVSAEKGLLQLSNALLVDEAGELCGIFNLIPTNKENTNFVLCLNKEMPIHPSHNKVFHIYYFKTLESEYLFDLYSGNQRLLDIPLDYYDTRLINLEIKDVPVTRQILAIDFGTSNSTAGLHINPDYLELQNNHDVLNGNIQQGEINFVTFKDVTTSGNVWTSLLPTIASIDDCQDAQNIQFNFGYEVLKHQSLSHGSELSSTFHEIKRWVNNYEQKENVSDYQGNTATISRGEIIQAYINFIISHAEQQFKCRFVKLHISSPVKLKHQFLSMFQALLPQYEIESKHALDEGMSVLYNTIANHIDRQDFLDGETYQALVVDCGGGTTDLSSCTFRIEDGKVSYHVKIDTTYENGDINFGGNNLTYRILQYLKIRFVQFYQNNSSILHLEDIFPTSINDVYRYIDEHGKQTFYENLDNLYQEAEEYLPTQFSHYSNKSQELYKRVQSNYYVLWQIAESVKKKFYEHADTWQVSIAPTKLATIETILTETKGFKLSVKKGIGLDYVYKLPEIILNKNEIDGLIKGDIYTIIKNFFEELYLNDTLQDYAIIKMTGQSCKIPLFRDAMKEFIAGKNIEFRHKDNYLLDLKLSCLSGVVRYLESRKTGRIRAEIVNSTPNTPYTVYAHDHRGHQKQLLMSAEKLTQTSGFISKDDDVREMTFYLEDKEHHQHTCYLYINQPEQYRSVTYEAINTTYTKFIRQDDVDTIENHEVKFFVYASEDKWGFHVLPISRQEGNLTMGEEKFFPFETEQWTVDFFDGNK